MTDREVALLACADAVTKCGEALRLLVKVEGAEPGGQLLRIPEAAHLLAVSTKTVNRLVATGRLASIKVGRLRRVPASALVAYQQRRRSA